MFPGPVETKDLGQVSSNSIYWKLTWSQLISFRDVLCYNETSSSVTQVYPSWLRDRLSLLRTGSTTFSHIYRSQTTDVLIEYRGASMTWCWLQIEQVVSDLEETNKGNPVFFISTSYSVDESHGRRSCKLLSTSTEECHARKK